MVLVIELQALLLLSVQSYTESRSSAPAWEFHFKAAEGYTVYCFQHMCFSVCPAKLLCPVAMQQV